MLLKALSSKVLDGCVADSQQLEMLSCQSCCCCGGRLPAHMCSLGVVALPSDRDMLHLPLSAREARCTYALMSTYVGSVQQPKVEFVLGLSESACLHHMRRNRGQDVLAAVHHPVWLCVVKLSHPALVAFCPGMLRAF